MSYYEYTETEMSRLSEADPKLSEIIKTLGFVKREVFTDFFSGLCYNIVGQQLSMKACNTLWGKIQSEPGGVTPDSCNNAERLKACGLSRSKADCIAAVSERFKSGEFSAERFYTLSDSEVTSLLCSVKGIGRWTAEMTLIFYLKRPDVLSLSDFGIRKGLSLLHGMDMKDLTAMEKYKALYSPYGTTASIYLWEAARILHDERS